MLRSRSTGSVWILVGALTMAGMLRANGDSPDAREVIVDVVVEDLARSAQDHVGERVRVRGVLVNQGKNYFTDRRVGLRGEGGAFVAVRPWLPLELPPTRPGQKPSERELLSDYLDQQIEIVGTLERGSIKGMGNVIHLNVESAVRIDSKKE